MSNKRRLTRTQERRRIEGLRTLARIIARHYLAHPELYPSPWFGRAGSRRQRPYCRGREGRRQGR